MSRLHHLAVTKLVSTNVEVDLEITSARVLEPIGDVDPSGRVLGVERRFCGFRFFVALARCGDLLLCAKHLFVAAIAWQRCDLRRRCAVGGGHELTEEKRPRPLELGCLSMSWYSRKVGGGRARRRLMKP